MRVWHFFAWFHQTIIFHHLFPPDLISHNLEHLKRAQFFIHIKQTFQLIIWPTSGPRTCCSRYLCAALLTSVHSLWCTDSSAFGSSRSTGLATMEKAPSCNQGGFTESIQSIKLDSICIYLIWLTRGILKLFSPSKTIIVLVPRLAL